MAGRRPRTYRSRRWTKKPVYRRPHDYAVRRRALWVGTAAPAVAAAERVQVYVIG